MTATAAACSGGFAWSPQQETIFRAVSRPGPHLVVEALAGTGKTTTIIEALVYTPPIDSVLMTAFNRGIADELQHRVPEGVAVSTLHSLGLRTVTRRQGRRKLDDRYTYQLAAELLGRGRELQDQRRTVCQLVAAAKSLCLAVPDLVELDRVADTMGIYCPPDLCPAVDWEPRILHPALKLLQACAEAPAAAPIDFADMLWLPVIHGWTPRTYDWVFVDETQDLNAVQLALTLRACDGRIVAVGDRHQAIYGFRGADREAIPRIIRELHASVLPLSVTYRCPAAVVHEANAFVPTLEAAPGAPTGTVRSASRSELFANARPGDFVLSRTNAPLLRLCFQWLAQGERAQIRGRDIGAGLASWIRSSRAQDVPGLRKAVDLWHVAESERLQEQDRSTEAVDDKAACLLMLSDGAPSISAVLERIDRLFGDNDTPGILLSSTHRAKGLEADRVWLLRDTYCKAREWRDGVLHLRDDYSDPEECNLLYVAITRSRRELVYVRGAA